MKEFLAKLLLLTTGVGFVIVSTHQYIEHGFLHAVGATLIYTMNAGIILLFSLIVLAKEN